MTSNHEARQRILAECSGDLERLIARLKAAESNDKHRLVTLEDIQERASRSKASM